MKLFELVRIEDESGVSGTGVVAQGVIFDNGWCSLTWLTEHTSVVFYTSIEEVIAIHGHGGKTKIVQIADCDSTRVQTLLTNEYQDQCENVHVGLNPTSDYLWNQRENLCNMFHRIELG